MKPNHFLTRLRQDIRKMALSPTAEGYLRYRGFARSKVYTLRAMLKEGKMTDADKKRFLEAVDLYMNIVEKRYDVPLGDDEKV